MCAYLVYTTIWYDQDGLGLTYICVPMTVWLWLKEYIYYFFLDDDDDYWLTDFYLVIFFLVYLCSIGTSVAFRDYKHWNFVDFLRIIINYFIFLKLQFCFLPKDIKILETTNIFLNSNAGCRNIKVQFQNKVISKLR